ncbi:unnamed protein product [Closterium sp. NIES-54]
MSFGKPKVVRAGSVAEQCDEEEIAHCYWAAVSELETLAEALSGPDAEKWKQSVKEEYESLLENETWELCELPPGKKAISSKLIFRHKYGPDGELTRYKSRLVAKGFQQTKGKDFDEIFAPVGKGTTLRVMLGMAANRGWRIKQMDITTAFLNGIILEELYMLQPEGLDDGSGRVCRLKKAIYGLKQAPRAWYHKKSECDHSLFLLQEKEQFLMLLVYVDDILLFSKSSAMIEHVEEMLEMQFKCSKMGDVKYYLGMHVERDLDKGVLRLHQRKFTVEPCADEEVVGESDRKLFHSMVGALNYAANHTRPDIAFATSRLASVVSRPSHEQLEASKRLVRYVSATASVGLEYSAVRQRLQRGAADSGKGEMLLNCYTDGSFNSVKADGTSIGGYVCLFGGGAVSWRSKKQNKVGQSSCETEYMALHHGAKEVVWLRRLLEEIRVCQKAPTVIFCDNESAVKLAKNACLHGLTKHIRPKWHWVRRLLDKEVRLEIVKTHQQVADFLTKRLAESEHWKGMKLAGMSYHYFIRLDDAWRAEFGDKAELPHWEELLRSQVSIFDIDFDAILAAMYALSVSAEGDCYLCVLPDPEDAALGASESALPCTQDTMVSTTTPGGQRVSIYPCHRTGCHLATLTRRPGSCLYTLAAKTPQVAASAQVSTPGQVAPSCSCRVLSHQTLPWHHRLGHPSLPRLRGMHSCLLVSSLPRSLPPLLPSPALPCLPCVEGRQRAAPHSSSFPPTAAPLQTLHMDVWGPARVCGQSRERYFLLVVDDYTRYTMVFPLRCKGRVVDVLIPRIRAVRLQLHLNLWPCVSLPETSPTLRWMGEVGDASLFRVWGSHAFVRDTSADKLSAHAIPCVFLSFPRDAPSWQFYHPTSRHVFPSQDVTFDESVPFYRLFPYRSVPPPPPPLFLAPGPPPVDPLPPQGLAPSGVSQVDPLLGTVLVEVAVDLGAARGAASGGAASGGAKSGGAEREGVEPGGAESGGAEPRCPASSGAVGAVAHMRAFSSLLIVPDPESDAARAASPTISRLLPTVVTDPSFESTAASRLDYATTLVAESESVCPPSVGGECALDTDVLEDTQEDLESLAAAMDAEMASSKSTGTYIDAVPPSRANIVDGMWIFRVKRPPGSLHAFKARYIARGFSPRQGVDYF